MQYQLIFVALQYMNIGHSIRKFRINKLRQTQFYFADKIDISQTYLSQVEKGHKIPSTQLLQRIADYCEVPLPIIFWYGITDEDVNPEKIEHFIFLKPLIDKMIDSLFLGNPIK